MSDRTAPPPLVNRIVLSLVLAVALDFLVTVEWSAPGCANAADPFAFFGFPFPYMRWGGASSLEYVWMPWRYAANIAIMTLPLFWLLRWMPAGKARRPLLWGIAVAAGVSSLLSALALSVFMVGALPARGMVHGAGGMESLRPVAVRFAGARPYDCTPSPWWFGSRPASADRPAKPEPPSVFP